MSMTNIDKKPKAQSKVALTPEQHKITVLRERILMVALATSSGGPLRKFLKRKRTPKWEPDSHSEGAKRTFH